MDALVDESGQAYAYTGDDPVNAVDQLGLCTDKNGVYLVPGVCDFSNPTWVQNAITNIHEQYAPPGYWDQVGHNWPYAFEWGERVLIFGGDGRLGQVTPPA